MTFKIKPVWVYTYSMMALLVAGTSQASPPTCSSTQFDDDGDGWGWENHQTCVVSSATDISGPLDGADTDSDPANNEPPAYKNRHPVCTGANSDPDGDGWGWENNRSCIVVPTGDDDTTDNDATDDDATDDDTTGDDTTDHDATGDYATDNDAEGDEPNTPAEPEKASTGTPVVFSQDFENAVDGLYQSDQLNDAWNQPFWHLGFDQGRVQIASDSTHGQVMQVTFPAGEYGSNGASAFLSDVQFGMELPKTYDELYLSYDIRFSDNFEFVLGGKLPGLCGANSDSALTEGCNTGGGKPTGFDGWSARSMWRVDGALEHYTYHAAQQNFWADSLLWNVRAQRGKWHRIQHRVVLNTVGARDGILEAWLDGTKVLSNTQMEYRKTESVGINLFYFSTFFGGNDPSWAPKTDQILYFDNFVISTEKTD